MRSVAAMLQLLLVAAIASLVSAAGSLSGEHSEIKSASHDAAHRHHHRFMAATQKGQKKSKSGDVADGEAPDDSDEPCDDDDLDVAKVSKVDRMKNELQELNTLQTKLEDRLEYLEQEHYEQKIAQETQPVANETVPALAKMLGSMRTEMHEFITPFYNEELEDRLEDIEEEQIQLKNDIAEAEGQKVPKAEEEKEEKEEKIEKEKEEEKEPEPKPAPKAKKQEDLWHTGTKVLIAVMVGIVLFIVVSFVMKRSSSS